VRWDWNHLVAISTEYISWMQKCWVNLNEYGSALCVMIWSPAWCDATAIGRGWAESALLGCKRWLSFTATCRRIWKMPPEILILNQQHIVNRD
jgi:hypothetical protein